MYERATELEMLADKVVEENMEKFGHLEECGIAFLWSDKAKKSNAQTTYADISKVTDKMKAICGIDFVVTFYRPNTDGISEEAMYNLMYHELLHVGYDDGKCKLIPHDVNDFRELIESEGLDWVSK